MKSSRKGSVAARALSIMRSTVAWWSIFSGIFTASEVAASQSLMKGTDKMTLGGTRLMSPWDSGAKLQRERLQDQCQTKIILSQFNRNFSPPYF